MFFLVALADVGDCHNMMPRGVKNKEQLMTLK
jgi:hypothetical protein